MASPRKLHPAQVRMLILMSAVRTVVKQADNLPLFDKGVLESFLTYSSEWIDNYPHATKQDLN